MKKYFLKDESLHNIDDDQFRYQDFANNLRKIIECNDPPFNVALIGKWGLGKSSIVNMTLAPMRKSKNEFLVCDINAWKYEKDEIGKAFLKSLWEGIREEKVLSFHFFHREHSRIIEEMLKQERKQQDNKGEVYNSIKYASRIGLISLIVFAFYCWVSNGFYGIKFDTCSFITSTFLRYCKNIGSTLIIPIVVWMGKIFMDKISQPLYKSYEINFPLVAQSDYEIYLENLLKEYDKKNADKKILVVVDDLDRLSADKIVEALDALKLFMEYERFIFIVPFDDEILKNALKSKRIRGIRSSESELDGETVLDKLFQYKVYLPQLIKYDMRNYAFEICRSDCVDFIKEYCNNNYKLFEEIVGKILIHSGVSTPRQVKKIINTFIENVMIARDREHVGKVGEGFATEKTGLQTIAKMSVLQSDYNEFYDTLFQDTNVIREILEVHRGNGKIEPSELLKNYFEDNNMLKRKCKTLVDYLIFTERLGYYNIAPYLYMSQTREGVLVGDKKQQDFMAAMESCNFVSAKQLVSETPVLISLCIEQLKYTESLLMDNIILSAIDFYDIVPDDDREELAMAIIERMPEISNSPNEFRYELINEKNLIDVCHKANSQEYNNLIEHAINSNRQDENYKNRVLLINKISQIKQELSDVTLSKFENYVKEWMLSDDMGVQDIIDYVEEQGEKEIANTYGKEYVQTVAQYIVDNDDFDDMLIKQFGDVIHEFLRDNSIQEIINNLEPCYDYPILHKILDESINERCYKEIIISENIAKRIVSIGVDKLKDVYGYRILSKLVYTVQSEDGEVFDNFFVNTVGEREFADMIEAFAENNTLELLPKTIEKLNKCTLEQEGYESDVRILLKSYTSEQAIAFWKNLESLCSYSSNRKYIVVGGLIVEFSKDEQYDEKVVNILENTIIPGATYYYNVKIYLQFAIRAVNAYKKKISQNGIDNYSSGLMQALSIDTDSVLNAYRVVNKLNSENCWCKNVDNLLGYVSKGTYPVIYDIIIGRIDLFNEENNNLNKLATFLVDYINYSSTIDDVINTLSAYLETISNADKLIHELMGLEFDENNAGIKLAKFIDACSTEKIVKIIIEEWNVNDAYKEKLIKILSNSKKYSYQEMLHRINENKESLNKNDILSMLEFCEGSITENNIESFVCVVEYVLEHYLEKDACTQILMRVGNLTQKVIDKQRENICMILVEIFRKSSSEENRRRSAMIIKDKRLGQKVRGKMDENELKEYKTYLS